MVLYLVAFDVVMDVSLGCSSHDSHLVGYVTVKHVNDMLVTLYRTVMEIEKSKGRIITKKSKGYTTQLDQVARQSRYAVKANDTTLCDKISRGRSVPLFCLNVPTRIPVVHFSMYIVLATVFMSCDKPIWS